MPARCKGLVGERAVQRYPGAMQGTPTFQLPSPSPSTIRVLGALFALYVVELVLRNVGVPVYDLVWRPFGQGFALYQPILRFLVQGDDSGALFNVLIGLLVLYFLLPGLDQILDKDTWLKGLGAGLVGGTLLPLVADGIGLVPAGGTMGWVVSTAALFVLFGLAMPDGVVRLFFVLPVSGKMIVWGTLGLSVLFFLLDRNLHTAEGIGVWVGVVGWWYGMGPGARRRELQRKASSIESELRRFHVIEGGRSNNRPSDDEWVH